MTSPVALDTSTSQVKSTTTLAASSDEEKFAVPLYQLLPFYIVLVDCHNLFYIQCVADEATAVATECAFCALLHADLDLE